MHWFSVCISPSAQVLIVASFSCSSLKWNKTLWIFSLCEWALIEQKSHLYNLGHLVSARQLNYCERVQILNNGGAPICKILEFLTSCTWFKNQYFHLSFSLLFLFNLQINYKYRYKYSMSTSTRQDISIMCNIGTITWVYGWISWGVGLDSFMPFCGRSYHYYAINS